MRAQVSRALVAALSVGCTAFPRCGLAQSPALELDHIYIMVPPRGTREVDALRSAGLVVDTTISRHGGQGTASMAAFFDNAYLELLWVDSATVVDAAHRSELADFRRAADWRDSGASPFGLGVHFLAGTEADLPIRARRDPAPHLGPNVFYLLLRDPEETSATDIFVVPPTAAVTEWLNRYRGRRPELFAHPLGVHRITRVLLHGSPANRPRAMDLDVRPMGFEATPSQYLTVEFDGGVQGRQWDLRPVLPLVLRR